MKNTFLFHVVFVWLTITASCSYAQNAQQKLDSLGSKLKKDSIHIFREQRVRPLVAIDRRNSFIRDNPVNLNGIRLGIIMHERHDLAMGFYSITTQTQNQQGMGDNNLNENRTIRLNYITSYYEYSFIDTRWWEIGIPVEVGVGHYQIDVTDVNNHEVKGFPKQGKVFPFGIGLDVTFKVLPWLGLNGLAGYRWAPEPDPRLNFNGAWYSYGIQIAFRDLVRKGRYAIKKSKYRHEIKKAQIRK